MDGRCFNLEGTIPILKIIVIFGLDLRLIFSAVVYSDCSSEWLWLRIENIFLSVHRKMWALRLGQRATIREESIVIGQFSYRSGLAVPLWESRNFRRPHWAAERSGKLWSSFRTGEITFANSRDWAPHPRSKERCNLSRRIFLTKVSWLNIRRESEYQSLMKSQTNRLER